MAGLFAEPSRVDMAPGAAHLRGWLDVEAQRSLLARCLELAGGDTPAYVPTVRGGGKMHVRMLCLGRHWNGKLYRYEPARSDFDERPAPPLPPELASLASDAARAAGFAFAPDICIMNLYDADGRMGLHQDKDESEASLASGAPVVSISIGDTARFLFGGLRRRDPVEVISLASGDGFVFGGEARLRYHGVTKVVPGTAPPQLEYTGRVNLTFRRY